MIPRTLRAANALLYGSSVLLVIAAITYCAFYKSMPTWQIWSAAVLGCAATIWGLYYVTLNYKITAEGISRHLYLRCTHRLNWNEIERAELEQTDAGGIATCTILLHPKSGSAIRLSSDVLPLDDMEELITDLRTLRLLAAEVPPGKEQN